MSISSLSHAAALLNNASVKLVVPGSSILQGALHSDWYKSPRFHVIYPLKAIVPGATAAATAAATTSARVSTRDDEKKKKQMNAR
jgi:hypothetical protein